MCQLTKHITICSSSSRYHHRARQVLPHHLQRHLPPFFKSPSFPPRASFNLTTNCSNTLYCPGNVTFCCITLNVVNVLLSISFSFFQVSSQAAPLQLFPQGSHYLPQPFFFFYLLRPSTSSSILKINLSLPHTSPLANFLKMTLKALHQVQKISVR